MSDNDRRSRRVLDELDSLDDELAGATSRSYERSGDESAVPQRYGSRRAPAAELGDLDPAEERGYAIAIMSGAARKGHWRPPETLYAFAFMGGVELDFRDADLLEGVTTVVAVAFMGGVTIKVPDDLDVEVRGFGFMGGFSQLSQHPVHFENDPDAPLLRVTGFAMMGGVDVKVVRDTDSESS